MKGLEPLALRLRLVPLLAAGVLALLVLPMPGTPDVPLFLEWARGIDARGLVKGYRLGVAPYPPLGYIVLAGVGPLAAALGVAPVLALKLIILTALALSAAIVWAWTRDALIAGLLALGLVLSGPALGYLDVLFLPSLLFAFWALQRERLALASALFALTCLIKWQPAVLAPVLLVCALAPAPRAERPRRLLAVALPALVVAGLTIGGFGLVVLDRLRLAAKDPYLCGQALNAVWIVSYALQALLPQLFGGLDDGLAHLVKSREPALMLPPKLVCAAVELAICIAAWRRARSFPDVLRYALLAYLAYFLFNAGVHENHLFVGQVLALLLYAFDRRRLGTALFWMLAANLNLLVFYGVRGERLGAARLVGGLDLGLPLALLNVAAFFALVLGRRRDALNVRPATRTPDQR